MSILLILAVAIGPSIIIITYGRYTRPFHYSKNFILPGALCGAKSRYLCYTTFPPAWGLIDKILLTHCKKCERLKVIHDLAKIQL